MAPNKGKAPVSPSRHRIFITQVKADLDDVFGDERGGEFVGSYQGGQYIPSWPQLKKRHGVVVMVHDLFLKRLLKGEASLADCSLIVFDECHDAKHTTRHPYDQIADLYRTAPESSRPRARLASLNRVRMLSCAHISFSCGQVLGLTATPAWGDTVEDTLGRISLLCEALGDASIEQVTEEMQDLQVS